MRHQHPLPRIWSIALLQFQGALTAVLPSSPCLASVATAPCKCKTVPPLPYISHSLSRYVRAFRPTIHNVISRCEGFSSSRKRRPNSRKLELNAYLTKPTTQLARYPLLLKTVLRQTPDESADKQEIPKVVTLIREFLAGSTSKRAVQRTGSICCNWSSNFCPIRANRWYVRFTNIKRSVLILVIRI